MAEKSASLLFPFEENFETASLRRATTVNDVLASAIRCFLVTVPGQRRGNPIGSFLSSLKHKTLPSTSLPSISKELQQELSKQFPGVIFTTVTITQTYEDNVVNLHASIQFSSPVSDVTELNVTI